MEENLELAKIELEQIIFQGKQRAQRIKQIEDSVKNLPEIGQLILTFIFRDGLKLSIEPVPEALKL